MTQQEFQIMPIAAIQESPTNPRRRFSEQGLQDLTDSVRKHGVLVPLLVRPVNNHYEIIAGARRFRAASAAGVQDLPVRVKELGDAEASELQIIDNLIREDVHPFDEALGYQALLERPGYDVSGIAVRVAKSQSYIYQRLKLLDLVPEAQQSFQEDRITFGHAIQIARLEPEDQMKALEACYDRYIEKGGEPSLVGVRQLGSWIQQHIHLDLAAAPFSKTATDLGTATACVNCTKRTGFMPDLFPDIARKDTCTHPACYQSKMKAHISRRKEEMSRNGTPLVEISQEWHRPYGKKATKNEPIYRDSYEIVPKNNRCDSTRKAIVVAGDFQLGKEVLVCTDKKCHKHHGGGYKQMRDPKDVAAEKEAARKRDIERAIRTAVLDRILERVKKFRELPNNSISILAETLVSEMDSNTVKYILKRHGWTQDKNDPYPAVREIAKSIIRKLVRQDLNAFLIECCVARHVDMSSWADLSRPDDFIAAAKEFGVDVAAVENETLKALGEETKQPKKKTKPGKK